MPLSTPQKVTASSGSYSSSFSTLEDDLPPPVVTPAFPGDGSDNIEDEVVIEASDVFTKPPPNDVVENYSSSFSDLEDDVVEVPIVPTKNNEDDDDVPVIIDDDESSEENIEESSRNNNNNNSTRGSIFAGGSGSANVLLPPRPTPSQNRPLSARPTSATRGGVQTPLAATKSPPTVPSANPTTSAVDYDDDDDFEVYDDDDSEKDNDANVSNGVDNKKVDAKRNVDEDFDRMEREYFEKKEQQQQLMSSSSSTKPPLAGSEDGINTAAPYGSSSQLQRPPSASSRPGSAARPHSARGRPLSASPSRNAMSPRPHDPSTPVPTIDIPQPPQNNDNDAIPISSTDKVFSSPPGRNIKPVSNNEKVHDVDVPTTATIIPDEEVAAEMVVELSPATTEHSTLEPPATTTTTPATAITTEGGVVDEVPPPDSTVAVIDDAAENTDNTTTTANNKHIVDHRGDDVVEARSTSSGRVSSSTPSVASASSRNSASRTDEALASFKEMMAQSSSILPAPVAVVVSEDVALNAIEPSQTVVDAASDRDSSRMSSSSSSSHHSSPMAAAPSFPSPDDVKEESPAPLNLIDLTSTSPEVSVAPNEQEEHTTTTTVLPPAMEASAVTISRPGSASSITTTAPITRPQSAFHSSSTVPKSNKAPVTTLSVNTTNKTNGSTRPSTAKHSRVSMIGGGGGSAKKVGTKKPSSTNTTPSSPHHQIHDAPTTANKKSPPLSRERRTSTPNGAATSPPANVVSSTSFLAHTISGGSFSHKKRESNTSISNKSLGETSNASGSIKPRVPRLSKRAQLDAKIKKERAESAELLKPILAASTIAGGETDCGSSSMGLEKSKRKTSTPLAPMSAEERRAHVLAAYDDRLAAVAARAANINKVQAERSILASGGSQNRQAMMMQQELAFTSDTATTSTSTTSTTAAHFEQFKADAQLAYRYKELLSELRLDNDTTTYSNLGLSSKTQDYDDDNYHDDPSPKELLGICNTFLASKRVFDEHQVKTERKVQVAVEKARQEDLAIKKKNKDARRKAIEEKRAALLSTVGIAGAQQRLKDHAPSPSRLGGGGSMSPDPHSPSTRNGSIVGFDLASSFNNNSSITSPKVAGRLSLTNSLFEAAHPSSSSDVGTTTSDDWCSDRYNSRGSSPTNNNLTRRRRRLDERHVPPTLPSNIVRTRLALESSSLQQLKKSTCSVVDAILQREATLENIRRLSEDYTDYPKNYNATMAESLVSEQIDIIRVASESVVGRIHEWRELMHSYEETRGIVGQWRDKAIKLQEMREREVIQENQKMNTSETSHVFNENDASRRESGATSPHQHSSQVMASSTTTATQSRRGSLQSKRVTSPSDPVGGLLSPLTPSEASGGGGGAEDLPPVNPNSRPFPFMQHTSYIHKMQKDLTFLYSTALGPFILIDVHNNVLLANRPRRVIAEDNSSSNNNNKGTPSSRSRRQSTVSHQSGGGGGHSPTAYNALGATLGGANGDFRPSFSEATHTKPSSSTHENNSNITSSSEHHHVMLQGASSAKKSSPSSSPRKGVGNLVATSIPTHQLLQAMFIGSSTKSHQHKGGKRKSSPGKTMEEDGADLVVDSTALTGHDVRPMSPSQLRDEYFFARMSAPKDTLAVRRAAGHRRAELDDVTQKMMMASKKRGKQQSAEDARDELVYADLDSMRLSAEVERSQNIWFRGATSKVIPVLKKHKAGEDQRPTGAKAYSPTRNTAVAPTSSFKAATTPPPTSIVPATMGRGGAVQFGGGGGTLLTPLQQHHPHQASGSLSGAVGRTASAAEGKQLGGVTIQQAALNALGATSSSTQRKWGGGGGVLDTTSVSSIMHTTNTGNNTNNNTSAGFDQNTSKLKRPVSALRARLDAIHQMSRVERRPGSATHNSSTASQQQQIDRRNMLIYARPMDRYCTVVDARRADKFSRAMSDKHSRSQNGNDDSGSDGSEEANNNNAWSAGPGKRIPTPSGGRVGTPIADIGRQGDEARAERRRAANGGVTPRAISANNSLRGDGQVSLTLSNGYSSHKESRNSIPGLVKKTLGEKKRKSMTHTSLMRNLKKLSGNHRRWWDLCFTIVLCTFWARRMRRRVVDARACRKIQRWFRSILHREQFIQLTEKAFIEKFRPRVEHTVMWWPVEVRTLEDVDQMEDAEENVTEWRAAMCLVLDAYNDRQQDDINSNNNNGDDDENGDIDPLTPIVRVTGVPVLTQLCIDPYEADALLFEEPVNIEMEEDTQKQQPIVMGQLSPGIVLHQQPDDDADTPTETTENTVTDEGSRGANGSLLMCTSTMAGGGAGLVQLVGDSSSSIRSPRASQRGGGRLPGGSGSMNMQVANAYLRTVDSFRPSASPQQDAFFSSSIILMSESNLPSAPANLQTAGSLRGAALLPPRPLSPIGARFAVSNNNINVNTINVNTTATTPTQEYQAMNGSVSPLIRLTTPPSKTMLMSQQQHQQSSSYYDEASTPTPTHGGGTTTTSANLQVVTTAGGRNVYLVPATMDGGLGHDGTRSYRLPDESISGSDCEEEYLGSQSGTSTSAAAGRGWGKMDASMGGASSIATMMPYIKRLPTVLLGDDFRDSTGILYTDPVDDLSNYKQCPPTNADGTIMKTTTTSPNRRFPSRSQQHNTSSSSAPPTSPPAFTNFNSEESHRVTVLRLARALRQSEMFGKAKLLGCTLPIHKGNLYIYDLLNNSMEKQRVYEYEEMTAQQRTNLRRKNYEVAAGRSVLPQVPVHCTIIKKKLMFKEDAREFRQNQRIAEIRARLIEEFNVAKEEAIQVKAKKDHVDGGAATSVSFIDTDGVFDATGLVRDTFAAGTNNHNNFPPGNDDDEDNVEDLELDEELLNEEANRIYEEEMLEAQTQKETERLHQHRSSISMMSSGSGGARSATNLLLNPWGGTGVNNNNVSISSPGSTPSGVAMGVIGSSMMSLSSSSDCSENNLEVEEVITTSQRTTYFPFRAPKGTPSRPYRSSIISVFHYFTECASAIQRTWRRSVNRDKMPFFIRRCKGTVRLQRFWRHHVRAVRLRAEIDHRVAATKIRRISYYFVCRRQLLASCAKTRNATIIRRAYLTSCARATLKRHRLERASATTIQRNFRGFMGRERARMTRHSQTILRFVAIRCITRPHVITTMINKNAAERIQRCARCMMARSTFNEAKSLASERLWVRLQIDRDTVHRKAISTVMAVYKGYAYRRSLREEYELLHIAVPAPGGGIDGYGGGDELVVDNNCSRAIIHHPSTSMVISNNNDDNDVDDNDMMQLPSSWLVPSNCDLRTKSTSLKRDGPEHPPPPSVVPFAAHRYLPEYEDNQELLLISLSQEYGSLPTQHNTTGDRHFVDKKILNFVQRVWREAVLLPSVTRNRSHYHHHNQPLLLGSSSPLRVFSVTSSYNPPVVVLQCFFRKIHALRRLVQLRKEKEIRRMYLATWQVGARWLRVYRRECAMKASVMWMHILRRHRAKKAVAELRKQRSAADLTERQLEASTMLVSLWRGHNQRSGGGICASLGASNDSGASSTTIVRQDPATAARARIREQLETQRLDDAAHTLQESLKAFHGHQRFRRTVQVKRRTAATRIQEWWKERLTERVTCEVRYEYAKEATKAAIVLQLFFKAVVGAARARRKREARLEEIRNRRFFK